MSRTDSDVVVVGGGIGGLAAALALGRTGLTVRLLERAKAFSEVGAGLQVGPNAVRVLDRLGLLDQIYSAAAFPPYGVVADAISGETLTKVDLQSSMAERFGFPYLVLHRADVLLALLEACRREPLVSLETERAVERVSDTGEDVIVECAGGLTYSASLLVGADGINSQVRPLIRTDEPVFSGYIAYRGAVPIEQVPPAQRDENVRVWVGPDIHLMQYPVRRGELYNQVAVHRSRRHLEGRKNWGTLDELEESFAAACGDVRAAIPLLSQMPSYPNHDKEPLDTFVAGRVVLVGDAAHPMLQYIGQGACQALEDGLVLAQSLRGSVADPHEGLARYDRVRVPRATKCQRVSRPWGDSWHTRDATLLAYRNAYFRTRAVDDYSEVAWLYEDALVPAEAMST